MRKYRKLLVSLELIIFTSLTLVISFAWIPRKWAPEVTYEEIKVSTSPALIISMLDKTGNPKDYKDVVLNDVLDIKSFELKQVSSVNGKDFMEPDFTPIINEQAPVYAKYDPTVKRIIETKFKLKTKMSTDQSGNLIRKAVFLHPETSLTVNNPDPNAKLDASLALRISITCGQNEPIILCKDKNKRTSENFVAADFQKADGQNIYTAYPDKSSYNSNAHGAQKCVDFADKQSVENNLFEFNETGEEEITVRIWLEGCDLNCEEGIIGDSINLMLKFDMDLVEPVYKVNINGKANLLTQNPSNKDEYIIKNINLSKNQTLSFTKNDQVFYAIMDENKSNLIDSTLKVKQAIQNATIKINVKTNKVLVTGK